MDLPSTDRRTVLKQTAQVAGLGALSSLAGCRNPLGGGESTGELSGVPAGTQWLTHVDVAGLLADGELRESVNEFLSDATGVDSVDAALDAMEAEAGFDPRNLTGLTAFGAVSEGSRPKLAVELETEVPADEVESVIRSRAPDLASETHQGTTLYVTSGDGAGEGAVALLGDGAYLLGTGEFVRTTIDTRAGETSAVDGTVASAYRDTDTGYVRFAAVAPAWVRQAVAGDLDDDRYSDLVSGLRAVSGSVASGGERTATVTLRMDATETASSLAADLEAGVALARTQAREGLPGGGRVDESVRRRIAETLDRTSVSRDGTTVVVTAPNGVQVGATVLAAVTASFVLGLGPRDPASRTPQAMFEFDYDAGDRTLTLTHTGGDHVRADELYVLGRSLDTDGRWSRLGGSTSGEVGGHPAVVAGDRVTLANVDPGYEVAVVWRSVEDGTSATLAEHAGPEA